jgi:hypothetical protein
MHYVRLPPPSFCVGFTIMMYHYQVSRFLYDYSHIISSRDSSLGTVTAYGLDDRGLNLGRARFYLVQIVHTGSEAHSCSYAKITGLFFLGDKWSEREADHSPMFSVKVKNSVHPFPHVFMT